MDTPLHATGLTFHYPGSNRPALDDVDLRVAAGECVALLGPNGAGKTTLIRLATGLRTPGRGSIRIGGGDPRRADVRQRMAVMMQSTALPQHLTVAELVVGSARRAGRSDDDAQRVLDEVGITDLASRRAHRLSGGQARRLQLARALVVEPDLLVLDEPTEGLDGPARRRTWAHLDDRRDAGMAILLTTHLIAEAAAVTDRVAVIADGRVVADDTPHGLVDRLPDRTIRVRTNLSPDRLRADADVVRAVRTTPDQHADAGPTAGPGVTTIVTRAPEAVLRRLLTADPEATGLRVEGASLADAVESMADAPSLTPDDHIDPEPAGSDTTNPATPRHDRSAA